MRNEAGSNVNVDHFTDFSRHAEKLLMNLGNTMTTVGQNMVLEQTIQGKMASGKNSTDFPVALQYIGNLSITLGELIKAINQMFGEEGTSD